MLLVREIVSVRNEAEYVVSREGRTWRISTPDGAFEFVFDETLVEFAPDIAFLGEGARGLALFWGAEVYGTRDGLAHAQHRTHMFRLNNIATFAIEDSGVSHCYVNGKVHVDACDEPVVEVGYGEPAASEIFIEHTPPMRKFLKRMYAKKKAIGRINTLDSVAGLECQVDFLTKIVFDLADRLPVSERPELVEKLRQATSGVMVDDVRDANDLIGDIRLLKSSIRNEQVKYFTRLAEIESEDA